MNVVRIGLDIAKSVFHVHGVDPHGKPVVRKTLSRSQVCEFFAQLPPCLVGLEACAGSHYWARELGKLGHDARLIAGQFVSPYRKCPRAVNFDPPCAPNSDPGGLAVHH